MAIESLLADGEEYVVTLEEGTEEESMMLEDGQDQTIELIVPEAHIECEVANVSWKGILLVKSRGEINIMKMRFQINVFLGLSVIVLKHST